jgi:hypothetical protein
VLSAATTLYYVKPQGVFCLEVCCQCCRNALFMHGTQKVLVFCEPCVMFIRRFLRHWLPLACCRYCSTAGCSEYGRNPFCLSDDLLRACVGVPTVSEESGVLE